MSTLDCSPEEIKKFQIMFMSMGEPFLNYKNLKESIERLNKIYPTASLLISTSAPNGAQLNWDNFIELSKKISKIGIQFSIHESNDLERKKINTYKYAISMRYL